MTLKRIWLVVLLAPFITPIQSQNCDKLDDTTLENVKLLSNMISSPEQCLREIQAFEFPKQILPYIQPVKKNIKKAFYYMTAQVLNILSHYTSISTLRMKHLQHIKRGLFEQLEQAQNCVMEGENENEEESMIMPQWVYLELSNYFFRIKKFLREKKFSSCAWEIVKVEIRRCFFFLYNFTKLLKKQ